MEPFLVRFNQNLEPVMTDEHLLQGGSSLFSVYTLETSRGDGIVLICF